ncbi:hypothetical protein ER308_02660 [Egibacter rhizosphaerae]|uniref:HTH luxR-type domain-containing protein n=1 Tax=Egibacter rhizosphaerae TaxID=1670831 RepID=A0A411YBE2_9ACTN|nr:LuxR C-terminal-related transcriptional regulator [Egibacter rhizosphaerae]QBI18573.1 hypothetical protein ER308_02660 [Egibacter rhizosphaerae]
MNGGPESASAVDGLELGAWGAGRRRHGLVALPVAVSTLVGRERERGEVAELLGEGRLVTLTGAGGCGKTRLALEVAGDVAAGFAAGACWVDLAGAGEADTVAAALAEAVGVREQPGRGLVDTLLEQLRAWHGLVVLDNCEHLVEACAALVAGLLRSCPQVRVLATSRTPLAVEGETAWEVAPLSVPEAHAGSAREVGRAEAARLFELRARQVRPDFALSDDNAAAAAEICRRLDGIPLAVELAAARVRVLSPAQIAAGLSDRFGLLTGGVRGAPVRQQTLEASVAWSFGLLSDAERLALARLSVFAGSFTLDAAAEVVGDIDCGTPVIDLLAGLVDQSLVQTIDDTEEVRYRLLETIRVYARQRLCVLDDPARVRERHLDVALRRAARAGVALNGPEPQAWQARLTAEVEDLRAAMAWAVESGRPAAALDIAEPTFAFWFERGLHSEMLRRLHAAVELPAAGDVERARGLTTAALLALAGDDCRASHRVADRAVALGRATELDAHLVRALTYRAAAGFRSGCATSEEVEADAEEAITLARELGDDKTLARALVLTGELAMGGRTLVRGRELLAEAADVCDRAGLTYQLASALALSSLGLGFAGDLDTARAHARRALELVRRFERPGVAAWARTGLAVADLVQGDGRAAREHLAEAVTAARRSGLATFELTASRWVAVAAHRVGDASVARAGGEAVLRTARERGSRFDEAGGEWVLGAVALAEDRRDDARAHLARSRQLSVDPCYPFALGRALLGLAHLAETDGDPDDAWELAHEGLAVLADHGDRVGTAEVLETVAGLAVARDHSDEALRLLAAAERFRDEAGIVRFPLAARWAARHVAAAQAALDQEDAEACWADGTGLSLNEAVAYARRGRGERARPESGWGSLTPAEHDLVRLVPQGCTNAEIGARLFMSVNTVKKHLSHVYAKLDVDGRADLAAEVARRDL